MMRPPHPRDFIRFILISLAFLPAWYGQTRLGADPKGALIGFLAGFLMAFAASALRQEKEEGFDPPGPDPLSWKRMGWILPATLLAGLSAYSVYSGAWGNRAAVLLWVASILLVVIPFWVRWSPDRAKQIDSEVEPIDTPRGAFRIGWFEGAALAFLLVIAFLFRYVELERFPVALHNDEANCGLMGKQILEEWRNGSVNWFQTRHFMQFNTLGFLPSALFQGLFSPNLHAHRLANVVASTIALVFFYLLVRELLGRAAGLIAVGLAATAHFSVHWARTGIHCGHAAFLAAICAWLLWKAFRTGKTKWFVLFGVVIPTCFVTYNAALVVPLWLFTVALVYWFFSGQFRKRFTAPLLLSAVVASIVFGPLYGTYLKRPDTFVTRSGSMVWTKEANSIRHMKSKHGEDYFPAILKHNLGRTLLLFNRTEDTNLQYGYHEGGLLDGLTASAFVVGLGVMLPRLLQMAYWPFALFIFLNLLLGSFFAMDSPQYGRLAGLSFLMMVPPAIWGREVYVNLKLLAGGWGAALAACALAGCVTLVGVHNFDLYFIRHDKKRGTPHEVYLHALAIDARDGGPTNKTFVLEDVFPTDFQYRSHLFVAAGNPVESFTRVEEIMVSPDEGVDRLTVVVPLVGEDLIQEVMTRLPQGVPETRTMSYRKPPEIYCRIRIPLEREPLTP